jgi:uncharacterized protein (TIGR03435 family)
MKTLRNIRLFTLPRLCLVAIIGAMLVGSLSAGAYPAPGTPAPPLQFTQLQQAPPGARADWAALRGKVVVLEFWATWCGPCLASMPHLNQLAAELDAAKFQFISVDDEDPKVVQAFLAKRKMAGWAGIDTTGSVYAWYGIKDRPVTIIVGKNGRIVAVTRLENVEAADLQAVAAGKSVKFTSLEKPASAPTAKPAVAVKPLYEVSLTIAPDAKPTDQMLQMFKDEYPSILKDMLQWGNMSAGPGYIDIDGRSAEKLLLTAYDIPFDKDRLIVAGSLPGGLYNFHAAWATGEDVDSLIAPSLQSAITHGLNLRSQWKTVTKKAYVLKATDASKNLLTPTAMTNGSPMRSPYFKGKLRLVNESLDDLAKGLEGAFDVPVVNETGIEGRFDAELVFPAKDIEASKAALLKTLGLELIEAERPIQMLEVSLKNDSKKKEESKPQAAPKP